MSGEGRVVFGKSSGHVSPPTATARVSDGPQRKRLRLSGVPFGIMSDAPTSAPEPAIQVAARLLAEGRPALAVERLAALVAEAPTYAAAHVLHATALEAADRLDDAVEAWSRAAALVPRSPLVHRERERLLASRRESLESAADTLPPPVPLSPPAEDDLGVPEEVGPETERENAPPTEAEASPEEPVPFVPDAHDALPVLEAFPLDALAPEPEDAADAALSDTAPSDEAASAPEPPTPEYGAPNPLDASDLFFGDPFTPTAPEPDEPEVPESVEAPEPDDAASGRGPQTDADWFGDPSGASELLPPEGPVPGAPSQGFDLAEAADASGWEVLSEEDVPTPPPDVRAEPDVVSPESEAEPEEEFAVADELDALIAQLEDAPRIKPDPEFSGPEVTFDEDDVDEMASETLAKIYAAQHQYVQAALIYEKLAVRQPENADDLLRRAAEMRERG